MEPDDLTADWFDSHVLSVAKFDSVFIKSDSRKIMSRDKQLPWVSLPTGFESRGYNDLVDSFDCWKAQAIGNCFNAFVNMSTNPPDYGQLSHSNGEPFSLSYMCRRAQLVPDLIQQTVAWAVKAGWLIVTPVLSTADETSHPDSAPTAPRHHPDSAPTPSRHHPDSAPTPSRHHPAYGTVRYDTIHNGTVRNGTVRGEPNRTEPNDCFESLISQSDKLQKLQSVTLDPGTAKPFVGSCVAGFTTSDVTDRDNDYWLTWYRRQTVSDSPILSGRNRAELAIVLALLSAVRRRKCKTTKVATFVYQLTHDKIGMISESDIERAVAAVSKLLDAAPPPAAPPQPPPSASRLPEPTATANAGPTFAERRARRRKRKATA